MDCNAAKLQSLRTITRTKPTEDVAEFRIKSPAVVRRIFSLYGHATLLPEAGPR